MEHIYNKTGSCTRYLGIFALPLPELLVHELNPEYSRVLRKQPQCSTEILQLEDLCPTIDSIVRNKEFYLFWDCILIYRLLCFAILLWLFPRVDHVHDSMCAVVVVVGLDHISKRGECYVESRYDGWADFEDCSKSNHKEGEVVWIRILCF